jgi:hypothetical protein
MHQQNIKQSDPRYQTSMWPTKWPTEYGAPAGHQTPAQRVCFFKTQKWPTVMGHFLVVINCQMRSADRALEKALATIGRPLRHQPHAWS